MPSLFIAFFFFLLIKIPAPSYASPQIREYYIAAEDIEWNYLPTETPIYSENRVYASPYVDVGIGQQRIGTTYMKSVFRGYEDATYTTLTKRPSWLGILGPIIFAEVGDTVVIHFWNNCSHVVTFHTHFGFYEKPSEGAFAFWNNMDGNFIPRGGEFTYVLNIIEKYGPTESDPDCLQSGYHSHFDGDSDIVTGLVGPFIVCKSGTLHKHWSSMYVLLFLVYDENDSWYIDRNIRKYINSSLSDEEIESLKRDPSFMESNRKYSINGLMYDNIPGLKVCLGCEQIWHIMGFGNEVDLHNVIFLAHTIKHNGHISDRIHVSPGVFKTATICSYQLGTFSITSAVSTYYLRGMQANFTVGNCGDEHEIIKPPIRNTRYYCLVIEELDWDYIPTGRNMISGKDISEDRDAQGYFFNGGCRNSTVYKKARYTKCRDGSPIKHEPDVDYTGLLGPVIRGEIGEEIVVTVYNKASKRFNFFLPAFVCEGCSPGNRDPILPGGKKIYIYHITEKYAPAHTDLPCVNWPYASNVSPWDQFAGLIGLLKTCRPGSLDAHGHQKNVKEYSLLFGVFNELRSPYRDENYGMLLNNSDCNTNSFLFTLSTTIHVVNGWSYGNLFGLDLCLQETALFNLVSLHAEGQMHVVRFEGSVFTSNGVPESTVQLTAGDHKQILIRPNVLGTFKVNCHVNGHILYGMIVKYNVIKCYDHTNEFVCFSGVERRYYIAAEEVIWDYTPNMIHPINGERLDKEEDSRPFVIRNETRIGHRYLKAIYVEYTDETFTQRKHHEEHLGILGPIIRGEECSEILILFRNCASQPYNMQPEGLVTMYDGTVPPVQPGKEVWYTWFVPKGAGPASNGFPGRNMLYHSTVDLVRDFDSGLLGMLIIYPIGFLNPQEPYFKKTIEFATIFTIIDENESPYLDWNIENFCGKPNQVNKSDPGFRTSNLKFSINGLLYGGLKGIQGELCDTAIFYICGQGSVEKHTAHFHGESGIIKKNNGLLFGHQEDVTEVFPGTCHPVKVPFCHAGTWFLHCHVDAHMRAGMITLFHVSDVPNQYCGCA